MQKEIKRGDIWLAELPFTGNSIQGGGLRPVVIIANSMACRYSPILHIIPLTGQLKRWMPTHVPISAIDTGLLKDSIALVEQTMLLPRDAFESKISSCNDYIIEKLDHAIGIQFGLVESRKNINYA